MVSVAFIQRIIYHLEGTYTEITHCYTVCPEPCNQVVFWKDTFKSCKNIINSQEHKSDTSTAEFLVVPLWYTDLFKMTQKLYSMRNSLKMVSYL